MLLETAGLDKKFNGVYALKQMDFSMDSGEIHGLVGENGAGKSTFIKILGGVYQADGGSIRWEGEPLTGALAPEDSRRLGINIIFQDNVLIPAFSGVENICLGLPYPSRHGLIRWKEMERAAYAKAEELGIRIDLKKTAAEMGPSQKKCVEIIRAMMNDCRLLILDEPTASLSDKETGLLFDIIRRLKEKGTSVLYVSHRLEEILGLTDYVTVLRNGEKVATARTEELGKRELVRLMSGGEAEGQADGQAESAGNGVIQMAAEAVEIAGDGVTDRPEEETGRTRTAADSTETDRQQAAGTEAAGQQAALEARNIFSRDGIVKGASLTAPAGKISGIFGLCGSGRTEFLECIYGYRKIRSGEVLVNGTRLPILSPPESIKNGMAFICEDRRGKALITQFSVLDNMMLCAIDKYSRNGRFQTKTAQKTAEEMINSLKIRCIGTGQQTAELSGGNQQKVVFARAMLTEPSVWLCDEPTQAVDVTTRQEIHRLLRREAEAGKAVIYVSSDLAELLEVADSIAVMASGKIVRTFENRNLKQAEVLACCYEAEREETA